MRLRSRSSIRLLALSILDFRLSTFLLCFAASAAMADPGKPVAVRFWGQGLVTIETWWDLRIAIDPYGLSIGYDDPGVEADLVLVTHEHFDHNNVGLVGGQPIVERGLDRDGAVRAVEFVLDRKPGRPAPRRLDRNAPRSEHAITIRSIPAFHDDSSGTQRGRTAMFLIEADGVRILHCGDLGQAHLTAKQEQAIGALDVLLVPVGGVYTVNGAQAAAIAARLRPRIVVPIHYGTAVVTIDLEGPGPFLDALGARFRRQEPPGNTLAVTAGRGPSRDAPVVAVLRARPWPVTAELAALLAEKERAAREAAAVFAALSVGQMNHRPADGTHTPRWNAEHVMGRELGFVSALYASIDDAVPLIDLNPQQMPPEYVAAHPDWTGAEEARRIERVGRFTRRFAYLLAGVDLDATPDDAVWSPRAMLEQVTRHYAEHTANVRKKFTLPDWPAE